ncbi:PREDICTED: uncharacterized protein LOC104802132 isoform X2 [Tarenaya hassleriana]|uniref:uncharacterized protein LOC104802132 isoform X2 n=1 Tax=Tarenaya hassleriana TaxID=28532 RepID=UPI00053C8B1E|nr:PREDICTED: uncharacterized protein LOC104802132 isoform X2 [Tarenaya hassleriana]
MALILYSYDFICFAIVAAAVAASLWLLLVKEGSDKGVDGPTVESLLVGREENEVVGFRHDGGETQVGSARLWTSCWRGMHPVWLLATRSVSFLVLTALLTWDVMEWGSSIFVYYTEWTFALVMIYFAMGIIASAYGCFKSSDFNMEHRQRLSIWGYLMQAVYQTCGGAVVLTDIVFWLVIVPFLSNSHLGLNLTLLSTTFRFLGTGSPISCSGAVSTSSSNGSSMLADSPGGHTHFSSLIGHGLQYGTCA